MKWLNCEKIRLLLIVFLAAVVLCGGSANADFTFGIPVNLGPTVNTSYGDYPTCISADGLELYIVSNRPGSLGDFDLWVMTRTTREDDWEPPVNLGPTVNSSVREFDACISADGLELYFSAYNHPGGYGNWDIWVSRRQTKDDPWSTAVNLGPPINGSSRDSSPSISSDGLEFYFCSSRPGGRGSDDIYVAKRATKNDSWGEPVNLGAIVNSSAYECATKLSSDSLMLFFSGEVARPYREGGFGLSDIWMTRRVTRYSDVWNEPVNLGPLVNSSSQDYGPVISPEGDTLYFGFGIFGRGDIYQAPIIPIVDFNGDGIVDIGDLLIMIDNWSMDYSTCDIGPMPWGDGIVDDADLEVLMSYWGQEFEFLPIDLWAYWRLDETEGNIAQDSADENDGTLNGEPLWLPEGGVVDGALQFDGIDDYISTPFILNPEDGKFSVFAWIKGGAPGQVVISQADGANWLSADPSDGKLMTALSKPAGGRIPPAPLVSESIITDNAWHHIGLTWDGSSRTLYVDDVEVARDTQTGLAGSTGGLYIGSGKDLEDGTYWSGLIDDVRIYNRAITP